MKDLSIVVVVENVGDGFVDLEVLAVAAAADDEDVTDHGLWRHCLRPD